MSNTLALLQQRHKANSLPLDEVRAEYFSHIKTEKRLRHLIRTAEVPLPTFRISDSRLAPLHVRLTDLAAYLDARAAAAA